MIEEWIVHLRDGLKNAELEVARRTLRQFVSKVVVKDGKGTIYYTFPVGSGDTNRLGLGKGDLWTRGTSSRFLVRNKVLAFRFRSKNILIRPNCAKQSA